MDLSRKTALLIAVLCSVLALFGITRMLAPDSSAPGSLPVIAVGMAMVMILALAMVAALYSGFDMADKTQALGLPEGSVRAIISLSLVILFGFVVIYLYQGVSTAGEVFKYEHVTEAQRDKFQETHPRAIDIEATIARENGVAVADPASTGKYLYDVRYRAARSAAGDEFAKQILTLLGTLLASITSYYLGAKTATSAVFAATDAMRQATAPTGAAPSITSTFPTTIDATAPNVVLKADGANLAGITRARLVMAGLPELVARNVLAGPTSVTCGFALSGLAASQKYDLILDNGTSSVSVTYPQALTVAT